MKKVRSFKDMKVLLFSLIGLCLVLTSQNGIAQDEDDNEHNDIKTKFIPYDWVDDKGVLKGGTAEVKVDKVRDVRALDSYPEWPFETIIDNGDPNNRVDLVIVGDGYDFNDINEGIYKSHVNSIINRFFLIDGFFSQSPLDEYASFFNVHRVDVNSVDSGVSYDPCDCNCLRNTALSMRFHETIRRLLYIPVADKGAVMYALNRAPDYNVGLALGNTETYGGSGAEPACLSGGNEGRVELGLHEFGHSFGGLADEYDYMYDPDDPNDGNSPYPWPEPSQNNISKLYATDMNKASVKWFRWLDWGPEPKDVWTFEGADHYKIGIYRPTDNSKMRSLGRPFEQVNAEQFIFKIYELVNPIDYAMLEGTYAIGTQFFVQPVKPATHSLDVTWYRVGDPDPVGTGLEFDSSTLDLPTGQYTLKVKVIDNTEMVRDEGKRATDMNEVRTWTLGEAGHWKFDEGSGDTAYDSIGDNNGRLGGQVGEDPCDPNWVSGKYNSALDFDGDDDYVSLSDMNALADNSTTIAAWIKRDVEDSNYSPIVTQYNESFKGYYFYLLDGKLALYLDGSLAISEDAIDTQDWHNIAGTNDGSNLRIYVDGEKKDTDSSTGRTGVHYDAYIGGYSTDYFKGLIDDVRVYDWAMDYVQIWEIMYPGTSKFSVKDNSGVLMAWFDDLGNLFLRGTLEQGNGNPPSITYNDGFKFINPSDANLAMIDATNGNMYIKGLLQPQWKDPCDVIDNFIIKDSSGDEVAYIDDPNGDMYLKGKLFDDPNP